MSMMKKIEGSVALELIALVPVFAIFLLITVQLSAGFHGALKAVADSEAGAAYTILEWEDYNSNNGLLRPCLEKIGPAVVTSDGYVFAVGAGTLQTNITLSEGVRIAEGPICMHDQSL